MTGRRFLIDVSRLIWRLWSGRLPTGVDRVCLAYLEHFRHEAQAVVQKRGIHRILTPADSSRLFDLLLTAEPGFRPKLLRMLPAVLRSTSGDVSFAGRIYLNIGHTGLNEPGLPGWIASRRLKAVYLIHDLIPITHPEFCREGEAEKHERRMRNALCSAAGIIGNSQSTIDDLARFAHDRGVALPETLPSWISGHIVPQAVEPASLARPHFVTIGTIEGRKNHVLLLQVWRRLVARLGERAPILTIVGQRGWEAEHALAMLDRCAAIQGHVRELGRCDDLELARLVKGARAVLMPSFAEGFGLPVVEALQLGTPVIASDLAAFREIVGDIPTYVDPINGPGWEQAVLDFLSDCPERRRQQAAMGGFVAPDWDSHFAAVDPWLETL